MSNASAGPSVRSRGGRYPEGVPDDRQRTPTPLKALRLATAGVLTAAIALFAAVQVDATPTPYPTPTYERPIVGDLAGVSSHRPGLRVLFVGDSLTFVNGLPRLLHDMAADDPAGPQIYTAMFGAGGAWLSDFIDDQRLRDLIGEHAWNDVVLQENSNIPDEWQPGTLGWTTVLPNWVAADHARTVLFQTWAHTMGDSYFAGDTRASMQLRIDHNIARVGRLVDAPVAPVGQVWNDATADLPSTRLYEVDGVHPSIAGSYLAAAVFYRALTGRPSSESFFTAGLPEVQARALRELADRDTTPLSSGK
jgi:hypothetical protein